MDYFNQTSERLQYRALTEKDIDSWTEFFENNDRLGFLGMDLSKDHKTLSTEWVMKQLDRYKNDGLGSLAVIEKFSGEFIGMGGILLREIQGRLEHEIAYSLKPKFWNKGYGTEMAKHMKNFGKQHGIAPTFISIIEKNNAASIHVAVKNGMSVLEETEFLGMQVYVYGDKP